LRTCLYLALFNLKVICAGTTSHGLVQEDGGMSLYIKKKETKSSWVFKYIFKCETKLPFLYLFSFKMEFLIRFNFLSLHGLSLRANYTDRVIATCRQSYCQIMRIVGATWSAWEIPTAIFLDFQTGAATFPLKY
jgi:hypothetical protein